VIATVRQAARLLGGFSSTEPKLISSAGALGGIVLLAFVTVYSVAMQSMFFLKFWILPICFMHAMIRSIVLDGDGNSASSRRLLFFPELNSLWGESEVKSNESVTEVVRATSTATEKVPLYRLPLAIKKLWIAKGWKRSAPDASRAPRSRFAATVAAIRRLPLVITRELLFWRKRDAALWAVIGATAILHLLGHRIVHLEGVLPVVPSALLIPFLLWKSHAARAVDYTFFAVRGFQATSTSCLGLGQLGLAQCSPSHRDMFPTQKWETTDSFVAAQEKEAAAASLTAALAREQAAREFAAAVESDPFYPELTESTEGCCGSWTMDQIRWPMTIYIVGVHALAVIGLAWIPSAKWQTLALTAVLWPITGFGITGGSHRLWAHRSYKASPFVRWALMLFASMANQGTVFHWARDHRTHHRHSETERDPHNATRGFFFAHVGWLLLKKDEKVKVAGRKIDVDDLLADKALMLQRKLDPFWNLFWCFVFPMLVAHYGWGETFSAGYFVPGVIRYVFVLNATWCVNSAAHLWGDHPYDPRSNPAENSFVAIVAIGEGWHNWHHAFPFDYAASELGISSQFNPTKLAIDAFARFGLVTDRKRAHKQWGRRVERLRPEFNTAMKTESADPVWRGAPLFRRRRWEKTEGMKTK
jgi:stearoyl-CoA desaturase (delta-9 desaturase)